MPTGHVKWFNNAKGYGFILCENSSEDFFVHYSSIQMDGYKTLKAGQAVSFEILAGPKGSHAINIQSNETFSTNEGSTDEGPTKEAPIEDANQIEEVKKEINEEIVTESTREGEVAT